MLLQTLVQCVQCVHAAWAVCAMPCVVHVATARYLGFEKFILLLNPLHVLGPFFELLLQHTEALGHGSNEVPIIQLLPSLSALADRLCKRNQKTSN